MASIARTSRQRISWTVSNATHSSYRPCIIQCQPRVIIAPPAPRTPHSWRGFSRSTRVYEKRYTPEHEWIELPSDNSKTATIGITTYASQQLGDVVYVELPSLEQEVKKGDSIGAVESVKSASDIMTPASGRVVERNEMLEEKPGLINQSPEGDGWIARLEIVDDKELGTGQEGGGLMDEKGYREFTEGLS